MMESLEQRITQLEKTVAALYQTGYINATPEEELNVAAKTYLKTHFRDYRFMDIGIPYLTDPFTNERIASFDNLFILESTSAMSNIVILVETKPVMHMDDIRHALDTMDRVQQVIAQAKAYKSGVELDDGTQPWSDEFKKIVNYTDLHKCDKDPYLIMGDIGIYAALQHKPAHRA
jgi:hypothetical protein